MVELRDYELELGEGLVEIVLFAEGEGGEEGHGVGGVLLGGGCGEEQEQEG